MSKVTYNSITFDSELEVEYYKYLMSNREVLDFIYHPNSIPNLVGKRSYTPDFIVYYKDRVEIIETKGYNPYSKRIDDAIHQEMLCKTESQLFEYVDQHNISVNARDVIYRKIKFLKAYGWVDFDFKNPNTVANTRKQKIIELEAEIKELKQFKKDALRYYGYLSKDKLTKPQKEWVLKYEREVVYSEMLKGITND